MSGSCFPKDILLGVRSQQLLHTFEGQKIRDKGKVGFLNNSFCEKLPTQFNF